MVVLPLVFHMENFMDKPPFNATNNYGVALWAGILVSVSICSNLFISRPYCVKDNICILPLRKLKAYGWRYAQLLSFLLCFIS